MDYFDSKIIFSKICDNKFTSILREESTIGVHASLQLTQILFPV